MASKPSKMVELRQGYAIGADRHKGFAECWNWVLSCMSHLQVEGGKVDGLDLGRDDQG